MITSVAAVQSFAMTGFPLDFHITQQIAVFSWCHVDVRDFGASFSLLYLEMANLTFEFVIGKVELISS